MYTRCMKRFQIYLTVQQFTKLAAKALESGLSIAEIIRRAVDAYLETT